MSNIYRTILEDTLAGYWDWDIAAGTEYISPSLKSMFGYKDHELENSPDTWNELIYHEDIEMIRSCYKEHISSRGKEPYRYEARYKHKNGDIVWVLCTGRVIEWDGDLPLRMVGSHVDITRQKNTEQELIATQKFLTKTNEAARIGGWEVDLVKNTVEWSDVTRAIHEVEESYIPDVSTGINFYKKGKHREAITELFNRLVKDGTPFDAELLIITAKGKETWIRTIGQAEIKDGKCIKVFGTFQDVDTRKKIKEELKQSEQRFREAFENSAIGMALIAPDGKWLKVNKQVCEITGYSEKELLNKTFQEITHPDDLDIDLNNIQLLLEDRIDNYQIEKRYVHKYGYNVWVLLSVSLVRDEEGNPVHFVSQIEDITKRKEAEAQVIDINTELTGLFESISQVSVIATDYDGMIRHFSKGAETLLGYTAQEMIDKQSPAIIHIEQEVVERGKELSKEFGRDIAGFDVFVAYAKEGKYESREWTYVKKNGETFPVQLVVTAIKKDGEITGFIGVATDISTLKEKEEQLKETIDIVSEQNTRLFNFAHIVSHNLRSHTSNLALLLELFSNSVDEVEKADLVNHLYAVSKNLSETITHLNEIVTIQTNINQQRKEISVKEYVDNTLETLSGEITNTNAEIEQNIPENAVIVYNEAYLESILLNFLSNAIKYRSKERKPRIVIEFTNSGDNGKNILKISDNGRGIDLERHGKKIFGMYKTFHGNDDAKGIGLFITKNQVEAMGGKIEVESEVDKGTTFKIHL